MTSSRALLATLLLLACRQPPPAPNPHAEATRLVLEVHCGTCHREDQPTAQAGALAVYNLNLADWSVNLRPHQLRDLLFRLGPEGQDIPAEELAVVRAFVDEELRRRAP
ncbi:MAG: hypothetical protein AB2A00_06260 [Myxococcota bacterium]